MAQLNPLEAPLLILFTKLDYLNGALNFLENRLRITTAVVDRFLEANPSLRDNLMLGTRMPFTDLTGPTDNGYLYHHPSPSLFRLNGNEYIAMADEIVARESAFTISQAYERFETFLFDVAATFLHANRSFADTHKCQKFERSKAFPGCGPEEISYWSSFVRQLRGSNNRDILKLIRSFAPALIVGETQNTRNLDINRWFQAASEVRHAVTHHRFFIRHMSIFLDAASPWFPTAEIAGEFRLNLNLKATERALVTFAEYGFLIYKSLSGSVGYPWTRDFQPKNLDASP